MKFPLKTPPYTQGNAPFLANPALGMAYFGCGKQERLRISGQKLPDWQWSGAEILGWFWSISL
ncbi:MAG: hypothetical protein PHR77_04735 [Kiritimatiellae bacterium]|nr:hypothetical protein [Kiritimatiellia bacterium]MDD5519466.1 hypothetical protein [Kiritimatiellia bacterium]